MKKINSDLSKEFELLKANAAIRSISDDIGKAAYILQNYCGEYEFTLTKLCESFNTSRPALKARIISIALGYTDHSLSKTKYLSPKHEQELAEMICFSQEIHDSCLLEEIPLIV